ncbi:coiled-coil domain-containing protein 9 isoform X2 [Rhinatrema bivittatum]|uniref:coiled-coil domain-containing protein 9 isoform X2 n=1 Tax=Rhinatrema bivittatum TaxID=194408 RepID=UPI0011280D91|nr:coiled-coil domain-containing protein 9 isoform X2 [Rhinatrema bivittatum]
MSSEVDLKSKEEKDAELDKRIEALRKKNQALIKRYQEIEEDRKKAEQEGIAVTAPRRVKQSDSDPDKKRKDRANLSITIDTSSSAGEKRIINDRKTPSTPRNIPEPPSPPPQRDPGRTVAQTGPSRSNRSPNTERSNWEGGGDGMGHRGRGRRSRGGGRAMLGHGSRGMADHEGGTAPLPERGRGLAMPGRGGGVDRGPSTDGGGGDAGSSLGGLDRKAKEREEKRRQNIEKMNEEMEKIAEYERNQRDGVREKNPFRNFLDDPRRSGPFMDLDRKEGSRRHTRNWGGTDFEKGRRSGPKDAMDMTLSMTGRERAEYVRWKKEREQIDQERLARHRKPTGQWRREWDAEKNETMFKDGAAPASAPADQGGRRGQGFFRSSRCGFWSSEESRRAPKPPTFGEFLSEGGVADSGRKKGRGRSRVEGKAYSMHDDRWEKHEEEEVVAIKEADREMEKEERSPEHENTSKTEEDDDEWEDASEEEEETIGGAESEEDFKDAESQPVAALAKDQRKPHPRGTPKIKIPLADTEPKSTTQEVKPSSPFSPTDGYQPVSDWGEEMELQSPRSSIEDSPLQAEVRRDISEGDAPQAEHGMPSPPEDPAAAVTVSVRDLDASLAQDLAEVLETVAAGSPPEPRGSASLQQEADTATDQHGPPSGSAALDPDNCQSAEREPQQSPPA